MSICNTRDLGSNVLVATAIVRAYCDEGFVVAADSRESGFDGLLNDFRQKIHQVSDLPVAYCMHGYTLLGDRYKPTRDVLFNFNHEVASFFKSNNLEQYESLFSYAKSLAEWVFTRLKERSADLSLDYGINAQGVRLPIATLYLDGFWREVPERVKVCFQHVSCVLEKPNPIAQSVESVAFDCHPNGSRSDLALADLGALVKLARSHIDRLIASASDGGIGGLTHLAVIKKGHGFKWVEKSNLISPYPCPNA